MKEVEIQISKRNRAQDNVRMFDGELYDLQGFIGKAFGLTDAQMYQKENLLHCWHPDYIPEELRVLNNSVTWVNGQVFHSGIRFLWWLNDEPSIKKQRKAWIEKFFKAIGLKVIWIP